MSEGYLTEAEAGESARVIQRLRSGLREVLFGQDRLIDLTLVGMLAGGHLLLEGLPGLGKTQLMKGLGQVLGLGTQRVQFTPDLLPGDITGNPIFEEGEDGRRRFVFRRGPLFGNLVLADEINRASPKTQSALLEAMQEGAVTVMGETHRLPSPFFVLATQNPIELEGTYPLPEAQLDRFLFKLEVYRNPVETLEKIVTGRELGAEVRVDQVMEGAEFEELMKRVRRVYLSDAVANFIARLVNGTHAGQSKAAEHCKFGASPRAALSLAAAARGLALMDGRPHASFEDVASLVQPVMGHRILLDYRAKLEGVNVTKVLQRLLEEVKAHHKDLPGTLVEGER